MNKISLKTILLLPAILGMIFFLTAFDINNTETVNPGPDNSFEIPDDIQSIFDKSCFGCHNVDAQSEKSKKKLMIDKLGDLSTSKLIAALEDIADVIDDGEMPPEKFLAKYPDKALTEDEAEKLKTWIDKTADELLK